jgi:hypothetical protein
MDLIQTISVPVIVSIVYGLIAMAKSAIKSERFNHFIPLLAAVLGAVLGLVLWIGMPELIPATNACAALIIGAASGWAATGAHQSVKQLKGGKV